MFWHRDHQHALVSEARRCEYGMSIASAAAAPAPAAEPAMTDRQRDYLLALGGEITGPLTRKEASALIDQLKAKKKAAPAPAPAPAPVPVPVADVRLTMLDSFIDGVPDGYYAVRLEETAPITFLRVSRPKRYGQNKISGVLKIQTQHSDDLADAAIKWPSGKWSIYRQSVIDSLMLLVTDPFGAGMLYASEIGKCCRCNKALTDERSRHYGVGPDCEKVWPQIIARIDEQNDDRSYETLHRMGLA